VLLLRANDASKKLIIKLNPMLRIAEATHLHTSFNAIDLLSSIHKYLVYFSVSWEMKKRTDEGKSF
jgi:hypothetical protein